MILKVTFALFCVLKIAILTNGQLIDCLPGKAVASEETCTSNGYALSSSLIILKDTLSRGGKIKIHYISYLR